MSIFSKFKHAVDHAAHQVKHTAEHAAQEAKHAAEHAGEEIEKTVEHDAHEVEKAAEHAAEKGVEKVSNIAEKAFNEIKHDVEKVADEAKSEITHLADTAKEEIKHLAEQVIDDLKNAFGKLEHAFEKDAIRKAIKTTLHLLNEYPVYPDEFGIELPGGITITYSDVEEKIATLEQYADAPPSSKKQIIAFVEALSPSSLQIQETIEIDLLVVSSSALEFGPSVTFTADQVSTIIEHLLDKVGVK